MKILIEIECDTAFEVVSHLKKLIEQVRQEVHRKGMFPKDEFPLNYVFEDDNCYGSHYAIVKESSVL
jgi:hypothetical protein